jgi:hypothetical protein
MASVSAWKFSFICCDFSGVPNANVCGTLYDPASRTEGTSTAPTTMSEFRRTLIVFIFSIPHCQVHSSQFASSQTQPAEPELIEPPAPPDEDVEAPDEDVEAPDEDVVEALDEVDDAVVPPPELTPSDGRSGTMQAAITAIANTPALRKTPPVFRIGRDPNARPSPAPADSPATAAAGCVDFIEAGEADDHHDEHSTSPSCVGFDLRGADRPRPNARAPPSRRWLSIPRDTNADLTAGLRKLDVRFGTHWIFDDRNNRAHPLAIDSPVTLDRRASSWRGSLPTLSGAGFALTPSAGAKGPGPRLVRPYKLPIPK